MTWEDAVLFVRGRGPPPVPSRINRVLLACCRLKAEDRQVGPARLRWLQRILDDS
jgi:hypothetical protein